MLSPGGCRTSALRPDLGPTVSRAPGPLPSCQTLSHLPRAGRACRTPLVLQCQTRTYSPPRSRAQETKACTYALCEGPGASRAARLAPEAEGIWQSCPAPGKPLITAAAPRSAPQPGSRPHPRSACWRLQLLGSRRLSEPSVQSKAPQTHPALPRDCPALCRPQGKEAESLGGHSEKSWQLTPTLCPQRLGTPR